MDPENFTLARIPHDECPWSAEQFGQVQVHFDGSRVIEGIAMFCELLDHNTFEHGAQWALTAIEQLEASGNPVGNGWYPSGRGEGWWYMTGALRYLPEV